MRKLISFVSIALLLSACRPATVRKAAPDWTIYRKAYSFFGHQNDSAFYYFDQVTVNAKDSAQLAMAFNMMAIIQTDAGDHYGAQESLIAALHYLKEGRKADEETLVGVYNELGMTSTNLKDHEQAIRYFDRAYIFARDSALKLRILNNKALAYQQDRNYSSAIQLYRRSLKAAKGADSVRTLTNLTTALWLKDRNYQAVTPLRAALKRCEQTDDQWGLNSVYLSLADYYEKIRPDSAIYFARKRYGISLELQSPDDQLEALSSLIRTGTAHDAQRYFAVYQKLNDSLQTARNAAKNQFALIRYNVAKRETDNLRLQKDVAAKRYQLLFAGVLCVVIAVGLTWHYRKRRRRSLLEQEMRMSKKVHDGVANGIYQLMSEVEHGLVSDQEELADKLDELYQRSRDISYEKPMSGSFDQRLSTQLRAFGGPNCHISLKGNDPDLWSSVPEAIREDLNYILQELMVNMKKHSRAANVLIKFELGDGLFINYSDDGVGLAQGIKFGNGLRGTENRIQAMGGALTFEDGPNKGLHIAITIPL